MLMMFTTGPVKRQWFLLGMPFRDELDVYPNEVIIHQRRFMEAVNMGKRKAGIREVHIPTSAVGSVQAKKTPFAPPFAKGWEVQFQSRTKRYVVRHLTRQEAEAAANAISQQVAARRSS